MNDLKGKVAIVTGSSRGIGEGLAVELARRGAVLIVHASKPSEKAKQSLKKVQKMSPESIVLYAKVEKHIECKKMTGVIKKKFGKVDILVNNAGIVRDRTFSKMTQREWGEVIGVNLTGVFNVTSSLLSLIPNGGRIVNISSVVGLRGSFGQANYAAAKAGVIGLTKSLALELARKHITVNVVAPGYIDTDMVSTIPDSVLKERILPQIPQSRLGTPQEIAKMVAFLAGEDAEYVTGQVFGVTGGIII